MLRYQLRFCVKYMFFLKHILKVMYCTLEKEGNISNCNMEFENYELTDKTFAYVKRFKRQMLNQVAMMNYFEELMENGIVVSPENTAKPFVPNFQRRKLLEHMGEFLETADIVFKRYNKRDGFSKCLLRVHYEALDNLTADIDLEWYKVRRMAEDLIRFY